MLKTIPNLRHLLHITLPAEQMSAQEEITVCV